MSPPSWSLYRSPHRGTSVGQREVEHLQGSEFRYIGVDELADVEEKDYLYLFARLRAKADSVIPCRDDGLFRAQFGRTALGRIWAPTETAGQRVLRKPRMSWLRTECSERIAST